MRTLILLFALALLPGGSCANEAVVHSTLKPVGEALLRGDFVAGVDIMYDRVAADHGGKKKLREAFAGSNERFAAQGIRIRKHEFAPPYRFISGTRRLYVIVPTVTEMETPQELIRMQGFMIGVEVAPGVWQFIGGEEATPEVLKKYFPDFPANETFPEVKEEVIPHEP